jgi:hypothetical protein
VITRLHLLVLALIAALVLAGCPSTPTRSRSRPKRSFRPHSSPTHRATPPRRHASHEHPHGSHPHPTDDHHHHPHPHPHMSGPNGHHHPY